MGSTPPLHIGTYREWCGLILYANCSNVDIENDQKHIYEDVDFLSS